MGLSCLPPLVHTLVLGSVKALVPVPEPALVLPIGV